MFVYNVSKKALSQCTISKHNLAYTMYVIHGGIISFTIILIRCSKFTKNCIPLVVIKCAFKIHFSYNILLIDTIKDQTPFHEFGKTFLTQLNRLRTEAGISKFAKTISTQNW